MKQTATNSLLNATYINHWMVVVCESKERDNRSMYEEELDRLEIRISYLEKQNEELNEVVIEQGKTITHLMVQMEEMKKKVKDLMDVTADERANRKPPHYLFISLQY